MTRPLPPHGTITRYRSRRDPCRCAQCSAANTRYLKRWHHDRRSGVPRMLPAKETARLVRRLIRAYGWRRTGEITGCGQGQLYNLVNDTFPNVRVATAARIAEAAEFYLAPEARGRVIDEVAVERAAAGDAVPLTPAERRAAAEALRGRVSDREAARRLRVTRETVVRYRRPPKDRAGALERELRQAHEHAERDRGAA